MAANSGREKTPQPRPGAVDKPGVISLNEIYTIEEAKSRLGWTDSALRSAKRQGLKLLKCGKRRYLAGSELARFLQSISDKDP